MQKSIALLVAMLIAGLAQAQIKAPVKPVKNQPQITQPIRIDSTGMSKVVSVRPAMITDLCPWVKLRGDNNFDNANTVRVSVNIWFNYNIRTGDSVLKAKIQFSGSENAGDNTQVKGEWEKVVYRAPAGWKIKKISNGTTSLATYFEFDANTRDKFIDERNCIARRYGPANFGFPVTMPTVQAIRISVHKREGDDFDLVESTCGCGFRIEKIEFKYLYVTLEHL